MKDQLFAFQEDALIEFHEKIKKAHILWSEKDPQVISFSAPTGAGKTVILTALIEELLYGGVENIGDSDSIFVWLSDSPELNEQTRLKIESKSDKIRLNNLIKIDASYNAESLEKGNIYFLNTQKLGSDKLLTTNSDKRQFSIWETMTNTAKINPKKLYVIIDEAHRGTNTTTQAENKAETIMQKFIKGSVEDQLIKMPLIIGVSATPQRFDNLIAGTNSTVQKIIVSPEMVRESGLLKDRIVIHFPKTNINTSMTIFANAISDWIKKCDEWGNYYKLNPSEKKVNPIFVVQVNDGNGNDITSTDIAQCINELEKGLGRKFFENEVVHTFNDYSVLNIGDTVINRVEPSRIEDDEDIRVVFFKMNLSTGWDCPRAETMMSFRNAQDYTYIAQLLGRMIRTPLAKRIKTNANLNSVSLYLPFFDEHTVDLVIDALYNDENAISTEIGKDSNMKILYRDKKFNYIFDYDNKLITYNIENNRKQSYIKQLLQLSRLLTMDAVDLDCYQNNRKNIIDKIEFEVEKIKNDESFEEAAKRITGINIEVLSFDYGNTSYSVEAIKNSTNVSKIDIENQFSLSGRTIGEGLHIDYWRRNSSRDPLEVKIEFIILTNSINSLESLNSYAENEFYKLYDEYKWKIYSLEESRRIAYDRIISLSSKPIEIPWEIPQSIDYTLNDENQEYEDHLFVDENNKFFAKLNTWEHLLINEELRRGASTWIRNVERKKWALQIPYEMNGVTVPMYPDLIVIREVDDRFIYDILEPHDSSRKDNYPKAVGLARFSQEHGHLFGRIQLIRLERGVDGKNHFYRLDLGNTKIIKRVKGITSNSELDRVFDDFASVEN